jgi:hypothetical protein
LPPEALATPTSTNSGTSIVIDWIAPVDNGAEITSYLVLIIAKSNGIQFLEDLTDCDGTDSDIISA